MVPGFEGGWVPGSSPWGMLLHQQHPDPNPWGAEHHPPLLPGQDPPWSAAIPHGSASGSTPPSLPPLPQTIPSTSPRSPFSPATTPAAASGSRTPCSWWCRSSGRSWPRSANADVPGSGSVGKEQPGDGSWPPQIAFELWLLQQQDSARGGRWRGGLVLPTRSSPGSCCHVKSPSSHGHPCRGIALGMVKGCPAGRILAAHAESSRPCAAAHSAPALPVGCCFLHF